jgi:curli biogenesis system outer membrane secretion channel CsgG
MSPRLVLGLAALVWAAGLAAFAAPAPAAPPSGPTGGLKRTVTVYQFQTSDTTVGAASADALTALLTDALVRDGRFVVVEREDLANVATEQQLGTQSSTTAATAAGAGKMIGASLIIRGSVIKYDANAGSSGLTIGGGSGGGLLGAPSLGMKGGHAMIAISLRVIDTTTGQVLTTVKAEGTASNHEVALSSTSSSGPSINAASAQNTPLGRAAEVAIDKAVPQIALAADHTPWSTEVVDVDGPTVYVGAGEDQNVTAGLTLHVRRKQKELTDPRTGVVLDVIMDDVGDIRIDRVRPKVSIATVLDGGTPARGDLLELK